MLVVEDDPDLLDGLVRSAQSRVGDVMRAGSVAEALAVLRERSPSVVIVDVRLPDGSGLEVVERCASLIPIPLIVAISGEASPEEAFALSRAGAARYLPKPLTLEELWEEVCAAADHPLDLGPGVAAAVGHRPMREVQDEVRATMIDQALAVQRGSRRGAARLLRVSRQGVQQIVRGRKDRSDD